MSNNWQNKEGYLSGCFYRFPKKLRDGSRRNYGHCFCRSDYILYFYDDALNRVKHGFAIF